LKGLCVGTACTHTCAEGTAPHATVRYKENKMKSRTLILVTMTALFLMAATATRLAAQEHNTKHHHYKLIDLGTLGGPVSYFNGGGRDLNNRGVAPISAETAIADPFSPSLCFLPECFVAYGVQWHDGIRTNLGVLPEESNTNPQDPCFDCSWTSFPTWITDNNLIAGLSENNTMDSAAGVPTVLGVLWQKGKITNLGTLGGAQSGAVSVNNRGDVVGTALNRIPDPFPNRAIGPGNPYVPSMYFANTTESHAFLWRHGIMHDLGTLGGPDSYAGWVNNHGQVAGQSDVDFNFNPITGYPTVHPFLWEDGVMQDLGGLGGTLGFPYGMNNRGDVVGWSNLAGDNTAHPFLWTKEGGMQDLGTLGGTFGHADFINERREVVGTATPVGDPGLRAFLWKDGVMTNLGTLGDDPDSEAGGINARGQIVGGTYILGVEDLRGFLWENGGPIVDLNTLAVNGSGIRILGPATINERGEMAAAGVLANGNLHTFLLIPCDDDHPGVEGCDYSMVDSASVPQLDQSNLTRIASRRGNIMAVRTSANSYASGRTPKTSLSDAGTTTHTLTGYCFGTTAEVCLQLKDPVQCPAGTVARTPVNKTFFCPHPPHSQQEYVDSSRGCQVKSRLGTVYGACMVN
jgi:probable HAF family extracellular repeat protein